MLYKLVTNTYTRYNTSLYNKLDKGNQRREIVKETQLLKGVLEGCVLQVIAQKEIYGTGTEAKRL